MKSLIICLLILGNISISLAENLKIINLMVDGNGNGIVQFSTSIDLKIYDWDWLWYNGEAIHKLKSLGSGGGEYDFEDPRYNNSITMKLSNYRNSRHTPTSLDFTCQNKNETGIDFRFLPASESEKADLQTKLDAGIIKIAFLPEHRELTWILRDSNEQYYIIDRLIMGPPSSSFENIYVGPKGKLLITESVDHSMAMCGIDHKINFLDGTKIAIFNERSSQGCSNDSAVLATVEKPGLEKQSLEILDTKIITADSLGLNSSIYANQQIFNTPCDLAL